MTQLYAAMRGSFVVCGEHRGLVDHEEGEPISAEDRHYQGLPDRCKICATPPSPNRLCEYAYCRKPLHPQWPAVYCSDRCAWRDACH